MIADLLIAWLFWFLIRWPVIEEPFKAIIRKLASSLRLLITEMRQAHESARLKSEEACRRELRLAGLAD
jgi:hypothetical protein